MRFLAVLEIKHFKGFNFLLITFLLLVTPNLVFSSDMVKKPVSIKLEKKHKNGENILMHESEYSEVFNIDFDSVVGVLSNIPGAANLFSSIRECEIQYESDEYSLRRLLAVYQFQGVGESYEYLERVQILTNTSTDFRIESWLEKSIDGKLNDYRGWWNVKKLPPSPEGKVRTEVTLYSYFEYLNPFFLQDVVLKLFGGGEILSMFSSVESAAQSE